MSISITLITLLVYFMDITSGVDQIRSLTTKREASSRYYQPKWSEKETNRNIPEGWVAGQWLSDDIKLGQVSGVAVDKNDNIYLFHRADRVWNNDAFNLDNVYTKQDLGPITSPAVLVIHKNGTLLNKWGNDIFYMPHGITVDEYDNLWVTDVALHQVIKFPPASSTPTLVLGEKFKPGRDSRHFCKPSAVAVAANHDFYVADGYCNSRILKFNSDGVKILEWGRSAVRTDVRSPGKGEFFIPHALALAEDKGLVCVADRENGRAQCFHMNNGSYVMEISSPMIGSRLFSVAYSPAKGGLFYVVNGPETGGVSQNHHIPVRGYVVSPELKLVSQFGMNLKNPHDLAISSDGNNIYVGEIGPYKAWKFIHNESLSHIESVPVRSEFIGLNSKSNIGGLAGAVLVTGACLIFAAAIIILAFVYSRSKKSGTPDTIKLLSEM